jgi:hypothetical protein
MLKDKIKKNHTKSFKIKNGNKKNEGKNKNKLEATINFKFKG